MRNIRLLLVLLCIIPMIMTLSGCPEAGAGAGTTTPATDEGTTNDNGTSSGDGTTATAKISITYEVNEADGGSAPTDTAEYEEGGTVTILGNTGALSKSSSIFAGWCTSEDGRGTVYQAGDSLTAGTSNITLYARWIDFQEVTPSGATASDWMIFGSSAALSGDGSIALIGAAEDDEQGMDSGAVYVFERIDESYTQTDIIYAPDAAASDTFGYSVDISDDGTVAVIGSIKDDGISGGSLLGLAGSVYLFVFENDSWTYKQNFTLGEAAEDEDQLGESVAISSEGSTIAFAATHKINSGWDYGCVYVYTTDDNWNSYSGGLLNRAETLDFGFLGTSLDINCSGSRIIAGAPMDEMVNCGSVIVFDTTDNWSTFTETSIQSADYAEDFGTSVSCSEDGKTLCIGAPCDEDADSNANSGSAFIYKEVEGSWVLQQKLYHSSQAPDNDYLGCSVALNDDGTQIIGGAPGFADDRGICSYFELCGTDWRETMTHQDPTGDIYNEFGDHVAISSDGSTVIVTSQISEENSIATGSAIIYTLKK